MCPEQIGVAPLSRSLASWTLVTPRRCLVNNCLIFWLSSLRFCSRGTVFIRCYRRLEAVAGFMKHSKKRGNCGVAATIFPKIESRESWIENGQLRIRDPSSGVVSIPNRPLIVRCVPRKCAQKWHKLLVDGHEKRVTAVSELNW